MQRAFDKLERQENRTQWKWTAGIAAAFGLIMFALVALTWTPTLTNWVSDAAQAEFAGTMMPEQAPVQTAQPAREFHTVRAN
jgi:NADH:ubiquinone oxidoreductase subunit 6 (subunit J)